MKDQGIQDISKASFTEILQINFVYSLDLHFHLELWNIES